MMPLDIMTKIFELCIIPILGVLTNYIIKYINAKAQELQAKTKSELEAKYVRMIDDTITKCVKTTNQTFVDSLKKQGKFDDEAQREAFQKTLDAVIEMLSQDAIDYINEITSDTRLYLTQLIESTVGDVKQ